MNAPTYRGRYKHAIASGWPPFSGLSISLFILSQPLEEDLWPENIFIGFLSHIEYIHGIGSNPESYAAVDDRGSIIQSAVVVGHFFGLCVI